jgi:hypothetical protein
MNASLNGETSLPRTRLKVGKPRLTLKHVGPWGRHEDVILLEERLDESWVASYRFMPTKDGGLRIDEVKLSSYADGDRALPEEDPPSSLFDRLRNDSSRFTVRDILEWFEDSSDNPSLTREHYARVLSRFGLDHRRVMSDDKPHRKRRSDSDVMRAAALYVENGRDVRAVASELDYSVSGTYKVLADARQRGFLDVAS